jgi:hypothetical protein
MGSIEIVKRGQAELPPELLPFKDELDAMAKEIADTVILSAEKAVAHHAMPERYPMTKNRDALEQHLLKQFRRLDEGRRQRTVARTLEEINRPEGEREAKYGRLARVKFNVPDEVSRQADEVVGGKQEAEESLLSKSAAQPVVAAAPPSPPVVDLQIRLHKVVCIDETGEGLGEVGDDEIYLAGHGTDTLGKTIEIVAFKVGDFNDGTVKNYATPKLLVKLPLQEGFGWPRTFHANLILLEKDQGKIGPVTREIIDKAKAKAKEWLRKKGQELLVAALADPHPLSKMGGLIAALVAGIILPAVLDFVVNYFVSVWEDDWFDPALLRFTVVSVNDQVGLFSVRYQGHGGTYEVIVDALISNPTGATDLTRTLSFRQISDTYFIDKPKSLRGLGSRTVDNFAPPVSGKALMGLAYASTRI